MNRKSIFILMSLILIGMAVFFYFDTVFLPIQFKRFVIAKAEKFLHRQVTIGMIDMKPLKGFIFENIIVGQLDNPQEPFIQIRQMTFSILFIPFFQKTAAIIPDIKIKNPIISVSRNENGQWNFADLFGLNKSSVRPKTPSLLLRKLSVENGKIDYIDKTQADVFTESVQNISLDATLSLNKGIRFVAEAQVPQKKSAVKVKGNYSLLAQTLTAQIVLKNIHLARYLSLLPFPPPYINIVDGIIPSADLAMTYNKSRELQVQGSFWAAHANVHIGESKQMAGTIVVHGMFLTWRGKQWDAKGHLQIPSARMTAASGKEFQGDIDAALNLITIADKNMTSQGDVKINNAFMKIEEHKFLKGHITATNASLSTLNDTLRLQGDIDIKDTFVSINGQQSLRGDLSTTDTKLTWSSPDDQGNRRLDVQSGLKLNSAQIILGEKRSIAGTIVAQKANFIYDLQKVTIETQGQIHDAHLNIEDNKHFQDNPYFNILYHYDPDKANPHDYKGTFHFAKGRLTGAPILDDISNIEGSITLVPDLAQTEKLTFHTQESTIDLSGLLTNFAQPSLDIKASAQDIQLQNILALFPSLREKIKVDMAGQADVKGIYKGPAHSPSEATIELQAQLTGARITHQSLPGDITDVSGRLDYKNDLVTWDHLLATYRGQRYTLIGQLSDFSRPVVDTKITSDQLSLTTQIKILSQAFQFTAFTGDYHNSHFDLRGDVHLFKDASPDIDLRGTATLDLQDAGAFVSPLRNKAKQLNPTGILSVEGIYQGKFDDWRNWKITFDATSEQVKIQGHPFQNFSFRYAQRDLTISKCEASSTIYDGILKVGCSVDLRTEEAPFSALLSLQNLDLKQLQKSRKTKNQHLAGTLSLSSDLKGILSSWRDLTGGGSLSITEGYLWQWNILEGISGILLIPEFKSLVFTEAYGDFSIYDQKIHTQNARMTSQSTILDGKGWIDFEKNLNFEITPTFSELTRLQSHSMKKGTSSILTHTDGYIKIKLTGTLDSPHHSVEKFPIKIIEETIGGTTNTLKEVIGSIVEEIF